MDNPDNHYYCVDKDGKIKKFYPDENKAESKSYQEAALEAYECTRNNGAIMYVTNSTSIEALVSLHSIIINEIDICNRANIVMNKPNG